MRKPDIKKNLQTEALVGLVLLVTIVGVGTFILIGTGADKPPQISTPVPPPMQTNESVEIKPVPGGSGSAFESYFGVEPIIHESTEKPTENVEDTDPVAEETDDQIADEDILDPNESLDDLDEDQPDDVPDDEDLEDWLND